MLSPNHEAGFTQPSLHLLFHEEGDFREVFICVLDCGAWAGSASLSSVLFGMNGLIGHSCVAGRRFKLIARIEVTSHSNFG